MTSSEDNIPKWITQEYFENVLKSYRKDDTIEVQDFRAEYATKKGEGYASAMIRVIADYRSKSSTDNVTETCLIKIAFDEDCFAAKCLKEFDVYNHELAMYSKYLPAMRSALIGAKIDEYFYPHTLHVDHDHTAIIFQDLKVENFKLPDPVNGLNRKQTEMVLVKLARMHAASAIVDERNPGIYKSLDRGLHCRHTKVFYPYFEDSMDNCIRVASEWPGFEGYVEKMKKLRPHLMEYVRRCFDMKSHFFNVLVHGDLWTNNIMFQHDDKGDVVDVVLFDYQFSCYTSPAIDLMFFINTSVEDDLRLNKQQELIEFYFRELTKNLKQLKYGGKILTLEEFWDQYNQDQFYCIVAGCLDRAILCCDDCGDADYVTVMGEETKSYAFRQKLFNHPKMQENLKILIPYFDKKGLFDLK